MTVLTSNVTQILYPLRTRTASSSSALAECACLLGKRLMSQNTVYMYRRRLILARRVAKPTGYLFLYGFTVEGTLSYYEVRSTTLILNRTAFRYDSGSNAFYPAELFVRDSGYKLISINIQYRLAAFGVSGRIFGAYPQLNVSERILGWKGSKSPWRPQCRIASVLIEMKTF